MTAGGVSDDTNAAALLGSPPADQWIIADGGCDADWFREASKARKTRASIPGRTSRSQGVRHDQRRYKHRYRTNTASCWQLAR